MSAAQGSVTEASIQSMTQLEILIKLYEGAMNFLTQAVTAMKAGQDDEASRLIERGRRIILEFKKTLDHTVDSSLAGQLNDLYDFMLDNLDKAELTQEADLVEKVVELLGTLLEGWRSTRN